VQVYLLLRALVGQPDLSLRVVLMNEGELSRRLAASGIDVYVLDETRLRTPTILSRLCKIVREFKPDILHTHRCKENILGHVANLLRGRAKLIRTAHGRNEHPASWHSPSRWFVDLVDETSGKWFDICTIAVSQELAQNLRSERWRNVVCIPNGIDALEVQRCQETPRFLGMMGTKRYVGFVGRLEPVKRCDLFVEIAARAAAEGESDVEWHIFGSGSQSESLKARVAQNGLGELVKFHGHSPNAVRWLGALDALVMTSDHEGMPMVLLEALAAGTPVIGHAVGGIREILSRGVGGVLVDEQDPAAYLDAIWSVLSMGKRSDLVRKGQSLVSDEYSIDRVALQTLSTYLEQLQ
jgi:glycosyltransferase involved in cell wall biosynthesis